MAEDATQAGGGLVFGQTARARDIVGLAFANFLLSLVSLTVYRFWARTRVRRYLWRKTTIDGEPLDYAGRGSELLLSFAGATVVFFIPLAFVNLYVGFGAQSMQEETLYVIAAAYAVMTVVGNFGVYAARGYLLSRSRWRGIRFGQSGSGIAYGLLALLYLVLCVLTLGLFVPYMTARLTGRKRRNTWLGDRRFDFDGKGGDLFWPYLLSVLASVGATFVALQVLFGLLTAAGLATPEIDPDNVVFDRETVLFLAAVYGTMIASLMLGSLVWYFYRAFEMNYLAGRTSLGGLRFRLNATALSLAWLEIGNFFIIVLTLTIGLPFAQVRTMRYVFHRLETEGALDIDSIGQGRERVPFVGEGIADGLGLLQI